MNISNSNPFKNSETTVFMHLLLPFHSDETYCLTQPKLLNTPKIIFLKSLPLIKKRHVCLAFNCFPDYLSTRMPALIMSSLNTAYIELSISIDIINNMSILFLITITFSCPKSVRLSFF